MTTSERLILLQASFDEVLVEKIDIHDWTAQVLSLITDPITFVELNVAAQGLAVKGSGGYFYNDNVATIRAALARAIYATAPDTQNTTSDIVSSDVAAQIPQIISAPKQPSVQLRAKRPKIANAETGLIWIWYHSDAATLLKLGGLMLGSLSIGFTLGKTDFFVRFLELFRTSFM